MVVVVVVVVVVMCLYIRQHHKPFISSLTMRSMAALLEHLILSFQTQTDARDRSHD